MASDRVMYQSSKSCPSSLANAMRGKGMIWWMNRCWTVPWKGSRSGSAQCSRTGCQSSTRVGEVTEVGEVVGVGDPGAAPRRVGVPLGAVDAPDSSPDEPLETLSPDFSAHPVRAMRVAPMNQSRLENRLCTMPTLPDQR